ncbi:hypothetical protein GGP83_003158 [Salinibacter ruber]|uniref:Uncharacterized protein n=1 Tax=Salinibacter ruber TaxID=146919 RepID=A0A9X2UB94_9BACT|nr:hypothetical protein [Salinibacter ruber]
MQKSAGGPSVFLSCLQQIHRMKLSVADQNSVGRRRHQVSQLLKERFLFLCTCGSVLSVYVPPDRESPAAIRQRGHQ